MIRIEHPDVMPTQYQRRLSLHFDTSINWHRLSCIGTRHVLYQAEVKGELWVARIAMDTRLPLGVDPVREQAVLKAIQHHIWAPFTYLYDSELGLMLMKHLGENRSKERLDSQDFDAIVSLVNEMHRIKWVPPIEYQSLFQRYRYCFEKQASGLVQLVDETESALSSLPDIGECLVHHDLHLGNFVWGRQLSLLDWEYGGLGNPWLDYATLTREVGLDIIQLARFEHLTPLSSMQIKSGIADAIQVVDQLETIWGHYLELVSNVETSNYYPDKTAFNLLND